jgi:hypothetical protein
MAGPEKRKNHYRSTFPEDFPAEVNCHGWQLTVYSVGLFFSFLLPMTA